jgi:hypothetical protein
LKTKTEVSTLEQQKNNISRQADIQKNNERLKQAHERFQQITSKKVEMAFI